MDNNATPTAPVRIMVLGAGHWGRNLIRVFHQLGALAAVCEPDAGRQRELAERYPDIPVVGHASLADALAASGTGAAGIDAVAIATPAETHGNLVRQALLAGKDVFVEKPLCLSASEGAELVALAAERRRVLMVGHLLWYHPAVLRLAELVRAGDLGRIQYLYAHRLNLGRIRREENILWSFAPHDLSVILGLVGEMPDRVFARGGYFLHPRIADVTVSTLGFPSGVAAHVFVSWLHPFKEQKLVVVGDRQMAVFDDLAAEKLRLYPHAIGWRNQSPVVQRAEAVNVALDGQEPLLAECRHFLDCCRHRTVPRTDGVEAMRVLQVLTACQDSLAAGQESPAAGQESLAAGQESPGAPTTSPLVHPSSYVDAGSSIGPGTQIWHFSRVLPGCRVGSECRIGQNVVIGPNVAIGDGVKIQNNVSVYEGVTLEDGVFCGPSMVFTNVYNPRSAVPRKDEYRPTLVRAGASLGANCTVVCGVTIGRYAFVGAGSVVLHDVPDYAVVVGNPGRLVGWMCACGERIRFAGADSHGLCPACGKRYRKDDQVVTRA